MARVEPARHRHTRSVVVVMFLLVAVLVAARTNAGIAAVTWLFKFLEFFSGVCALVGFTAAVFAGVVAAQRIVPIRFRIMAQAVHRAMVYMSFGFLISHVTLKIVEAHASFIDIVIPFASHRGLYIGLGTIASDMAIIILGTGLLRGRFVSLTRPWVWRTVHALSYLMWPISIYHGLLAGRPPMGAWVVWSYIITFGVTMLLATSRLPRLQRDRRMLRAQQERQARQAREISVARAGRMARTRVVERPSRTAVATEDDGVPDAEFWASLRTETAGWIGRR